MTPEEFKLIRKKYKFTQKQFAEKLGKGLRTIQDYEQGKYKVPLHIIKMLYIIELNKVFEDCIKQNEKNGIESYPNQVNQTEIMIKSNEDNKTEKLPSCSTSFTTDKWGPYYIWSRQFIDRPSQKKTKKSGIEINILPSDRNKEISAKIEEAINNMAQNEK